MRELWEQITKINYWKLTTIIATLLIVDLYVALYDDFERIHDPMLRALQNSSLIFAIVISLATALGTNYIKGLRESYWKQVSSIRGRLETAHRDCKDSEHSELREIAEKCLMPMLQLTPDEWCQPTEEPLSLYYAAKLEPAERLFKSHGIEALPMSIIRMEEEVEDLIVQLMRRAIAKHIAEDIKQSFKLLTVSIVAISLIYLMPASLIGAFLSINVAVVLITFSVYEIWKLHGEFARQFQEEFPEDPTEY